MSDLTIFERHPTMDAYRVGGSFTPYAIVGKDKRFSDAELAAEYWRHNGDTDAVYEGIRVTTFGNRVANGWFAEDLMKARLDALSRFATLPHYDEAGA